MSRSSTVPVATTMMDFSIVTVNADNVDELGFFCVKNKKHSGYTAKRSWLDQRFEEGMRIKLLLTAEGEQVGFLECIPGQHTWRVIYAPDHLVIHCIWVRSRKTPLRGMAPALLDSCLEDVASAGKDGLAVVTGDGPWMAGRAVFLKNGFKQVDEAPPRFQLLVRQTGRGPLPTFPSNWDERLSQYHDLQLLYTNQCPYIGKAVAELPQVAERHGTRLHLMEMGNSAEARRKMPSAYGVFSLVYQGRLLADHPISATRFRNILQKDLKLQPRDCN